MQDFAPYTDDAGRCETIRITMFDELDYPLDQLDDIGDNLPVFNENYIKNEIIGNETDALFTIFKDNREEIGFTYSIKTVSKDYSKVIFGDKLFRRNALVNESSPSQIKLYAFDSKVFDKSTTGKVPIEGTVNVNYRFTTIPNLSINYTTNKITVGSNAIDLDLNGANPQSWCLTDGDDNILIAVNQGDNNYDTIVFDFSSKRSDINYLY